MNTEYEDELSKKLIELDLDEIVDILLNEDNPKTKKFIKKFIGENFGPTPQFELTKAIKEIEKLNYRDFLKERLTNVKIFIRDIKERLDGEHINSFAEVEIILSESINLNKVFKDT